MNGVALFRTRKNTVCSGTDVIAFFLLLLTSLLTSAISSAANTKASKHSIPYYEKTETILVLGAVPQEIPYLVDKLKDKKEKSLWGIPYWEGKLHGKPAVIAITGIGKTFTGMTTTLFIHHFKPRLALMTGTGARINKELRTGDVIVATSTFEHDYGSLTENGMVYRELNGPINGAEIMNKTKTPQDLMYAAQKALKNFEPQTITIDNKSYKTKARFGIVSSSDLFGVTERRIKMLREEYNTDIMEMESAPFAHVCDFAQVPYLIVRSGSNQAQEAPNDDYLKFGPIAAKEAAKFTYQLIQNLED